MSKVKPVRLQRLRKKGFNLQEISMAKNGIPCVCVTRGTEFGNPFKVGGLFKLAPKEKMFAGFTYIQCLNESINDGTFTKIENNEQAVEMYKKYLKIFPLRKEQIEKLRGKNLACFCKDNKETMCHAEILLILANPNIKFDFHDKYKNMLNL